MGRVGSWEVIQSITLTLYFPTLYIDDLSRLKKKIPSPFLLSLSILSTSHCQKCCSIELAAKLSLMLATVNVLTLWGKEGTGILFLFSCSQKNVMFLNMMLYRMGVGHMTSRIKLIPLK